jgi:ribosome-associated translation inhibitor RaiA
MSEDVALAIHWTLEADESLRDQVEQRCRTLAREFPEITHLDVTLSEEGAGYAASGHVTGKGTEVAGHATAPEPELAAEKLLDTLRLRLRRTHDKRIFTRRREAQKKNPKRGGGPPTR